jgi:tight adherence protein B
VIATTLLAAAAVFLAAVAAGRALLVRRMRVLGTLAVMVEPPPEPDPADAHRLSAGTAAPPSRLRLRQSLLHGIQRHAQLLRLGPLVRWAERSLRGSGLPLRPEEFLALSAGGLVLGWLVGVVFRPAGFVRLLLVAAGLLAPTLAVRRARGLRRTRVSAQLSDVLTTLGNGLRAGHGLFQALEGTARQCPPPLGDELRRLQREVAAGIPVEEALLRLQRRVDNDDLELVVTAILVQRQVGGNLAEVLDKIAGTIRARVQVQGHLRVVTAQSRLSAWVVSLVPVAVFGLTTLIAPQVEHTLLVDPLGRLVAGLAVLLEVFGVLAIRKAVSVRY